MSNSAYMEPRLIAVSANHSETPRIMMTLGVFGMLSNHDQFIPANISSKGLLCPKSSLISTSLPNPGVVTLIDVTLDYYCNNSQVHDMYNRTFNLSGDGSYS